MKNVMSIDPGLRSIGVYINIQEGEDMAFTIKALKSDTEKEIYNNIDMILRELIAFYKIKVIFCEDYAITGFQRKSGAQLAEIKGLLKKIVYDESLAIDGMILVPISTWKSIHKGLSLPKNKTKKYVELVNKTFKKKLNTSDEVDAYLMLVAMYMISRGVVKSNTQIRLKKDMETLGEIWPVKIKIIDPKKIN